MKRGSSALKYLVACAKAIQDGGKLKRVDSLLEQIWNLAANESDPQQRKVVKYFAEALVRRAYGLHPPINANLNSQRCHYGFAQVVADAINTHALRRKKRLHLIVFGVPSPVEETYWLRILDLSRELLSVRVSFILREKSVNFRQERQFFIDQAEDYKVELEDLKVVYANSLDEVDASMLDFRRTEDEAVVVSYMYRLHTLLAEAGAMEKELSKLRQINPEMVIIEEQEANNNDSNFIKRLKDSFQYYSHASQHNYRFDYSKDQKEKCYRREIGNIVGCEGRNRVERHQTLGQWRDRLRRAGFLPLPLSLRNLFYIYKTEVREKDGCLAYTILDRPMVSLSAWKLTESEDHFNPISFNTVQVQGFNPTPPSEDIVKPLQVSSKCFSLNRLAAFAEIYDMLEEVCDKYKLDLALTWAHEANVKRAPNEIMSDPHKKHILSIERSCCHGDDSSSWFLESIAEDSGMVLARKALQSNEPFLFERSIKFSESICVVAICLQNHYADDVYVLEFFSSFKFFSLFKKEPESLAPRIFHDLKDMKKKFVKLRVHGTEVGFQKEAISNIPRATTPMKSSPPASSTNDFLNSLNMAEPRESHALEMQVLNEQGGFIPNSHPSVPIRTSSPAGTGPSQAPNPMSYDGLETQVPYEQEMREKKCISQTIPNSDPEMVKANRENSAPPRTRHRKLVSEVWKDFDKFEENGKQLAKCKHCKKDFPGSSKSGTTHLKNHLTKHCPSKKNEYQERQLKVPGKTGDLTIRDTNEGNLIFDLDKSRLDFAKMIIKHQYPLDMAGQEFFKNFVKNLQPRFEFPSQATILSDTHRIYVEEKEKLYQHFDQLACSLSLTISLWKDKLRKNAYCCLIAHFIDDDWELKMKILAFKNLEHNYDTVTICEIIRNSLSEWNMGKKVCSITVENFSLNDDIVQQIEEKCLSDKGSLPLGSCYISCTLIQDGLHEMDDVLLKMRKSIEYVSETEHGKLKFQEAVNQVKLQGGKSRDDPLRLDSDFGILDSALESREIFCQLEQIDDNFRVNPSMEEWDRALALHGCLKGFYDILSNFEGTQSLTANAYFPKLCDVYQKFLQLEKSNHAVITAVKGRFDNYWSLCNLVFAVAAVLDPRLKFKFVEFSYSKIYAHDIEKQLNRFHKVLADVYYEYANEHRNLPTSASGIGDLSCSKGQSTEIANDCILDSFSRYASASNFNEVASWKSELYRYLDEPLLGLDGAFFDILGWWRVNSERFPILGRMARDLLAIPVSIVPPCSDFSAVITNPDYSGLNPESMEALVCSQNWLEMPKANDRANHVPLQKTAKRKMDEKETHEVESCKNWNFEETNGGDKVQASCKMMRTLLLENIGQKERPLKSSEPNHGRDIKGLIEIPNDSPSFDNWLEVQCSSSDESDGEIPSREQGAWREEDVRAYLVSPFTEKEKKRVNRWQSHEMSGKMVGRDKEFGVVDYKLAPLLIVPHGDETGVEYYINDLVVNTFFKLLKKRSDRFPKAYVNHYSFDSQIATYLIEGSRSDDEVLRWFKDDKKLISVHKLFLPLCLSAHWILFYIDTKKQKFSWLDSNISSRTSNNVEKGTILRWFIRYLLPACGYKNANQWPFELRTDIPAQTNLVDCGLFVMKYADCLTHGDFFPFTQQDMPHFRCRTFLDLYHGNFVQH